MTGQRIGPRIGERIERPSVYAPPAVVVPEYTSLDTAPWWQWWPGGVLLMVKRAEKAGWAALVGFSRCAGVDSVGVWVDGYGKRGAAFWDRRPDAEFTEARLEKGVTHEDVPSGALWSAGGTIIRGVLAQPGAAWTYANHTEFGVWLAAQGTMPAEWYLASRARVMAARAKAATRITVEVPECE